MADVDIIHGLSVTVTVAYVMSVQDYVSSELRSPIAYMRSGPALQNLLESKHMSRVYSDNSTCI